MKKNVTIFITVIFSCFLSPAYGQWPKYIIDDNINMGISVDVADMDGDSKPDLVVTNENGNELILYQNNYPHWTKHIIDEIKAGFAYYGDMDGNDTLDVVASHLSPREMVWYENNYPTWTKHYIDENPVGSNFMFVADFDNDDTLDVVTAGGYVIGGDVAWYENNHPDWSKHIIESGSGKYSCLNVIDMDNDGFLDVIAIEYSVNKVVWFRNEDNGLFWTKYTFDENLNNAFGLNIGDIDGNDTIDILATSTSANDVVWYENNHPTWTKHIIDTNLIGACWLCVNDVDGNDTMDIIAAGLNGNIVVWYKNNHPIWTKHIIDTDLSGPRVFAVSDVDGDNVDDIIVPALTNVVWYKNTYTTTAFTESLDVSLFHVKSPDDTLKVKASLSNPGDHQVNLYAIIQGNQFAYVDSLQLFDDGLHNDDDSLDNIWGNIKLLSGLPEDDYIVDLVTHDLTSVITHYYHEPARMINFGPVSYKGYAFDESDTEPNPGDRLRLELTLRNDGSVAAATGIEAALVSLDTLVTVPSYGRSFQDMPAGENMTADNTFRVNISDECPVNTEVAIEVNISSYDHICWIDTLSFNVLPTYINELTEPVTRIYPNPAYDVLNIEIGNTGSQGIEIEILDITGKAFYQKEYGDIDAYFTEQIDLSGYAKGIYLVKVRQANSVNVGKVVMR